MLFQFLILEIENSPETSLLILHLQGLRREIEDSFNKIAGLRLEPKLLSDPGQHEPLLNSFVDDRGMEFFKIGIFLGLRLYGKVRLVCRISQTLLAENKIFLEENC